MPFTALDNSALTFTEALWVQKRLAAHGFNPGPIDGDPGPRTNAAATAFKVSIGFRARPFVGPKTKAMLAQAHDTVPDIAQEDPPWIREGRKYIGLHEDANNRELREFLASDGHALGDPSVYPWCGDFEETIIRLSLPKEPFPGDLGRNPYWALNWQLFGVATEPCLGALWSFPRSGGGHITNIVGENASYYFCLGGNQSNRVSIAPVSKDRYEYGQMRWPSTYLGAKQPLPWYNSTAEAENNFA